MSLLVGLPIDILILVLESLDIHDLTILSQICRSMHSLVTQYGWSAYVRINPRRSYSLSNARSQWHPRTHARYDYLSDSRWASCTFIARPLSTKWTGKFQPVLTISPSRLIVAAGSSIYSYSFGLSSNSFDSPPVCFEGQATFLDHLDRPQYITALTFVQVASNPDSVLNIGFEDGSIERVQLSPIHQSPIPITRHKLQSMPRNDFIESFSTHSEFLLALSATGYARLSTTSGDSTNTIELKKRSWSCHLSLTSNTPYAAFGSCSSTPLTIHSIDGARLSPHPSAILHTKSSSVSDLNTFDESTCSAVYGLSHAPPNSPWGSSPQILVSGWYDGQVRIYDLRSPSSFSIRPPLSSTSGPTTHTSPIAVHRPVLSLVDRWSYEPIYAVAAGGGAAAHVAAGTARHSVVSFWDVRQPSTGWSVHAPGNDSSPVYSVILESSRFFGATQSRPFVYDFGPGVSVGTYPALPQRGGDNLKRKKGSHRATYHVISYDHSGSGFCKEH